MNRWWSKLLSCYPSPRVGTQPMELVLSVLSWMICTWWCRRCRYFLHGCRCRKCMAIARSEGKSSFAADHWVQNVCAATFWVLDPDIWSNVGRFLLAWMHMASYDLRPGFLVCEPPIPKNFGIHCLPRSYLYHRRCECSDEATALSVNVSSILQILFGGAGGTLVTKTSRFRLGTFFP